MADILIKTKFDGLYYKLNKLGTKVYVARIYKDGKNTTKTLGKEPALNLRTANKLRLDMVDSLNGGISIKNLKKSLNDLFPEYLETRRKSVSESYLYACEKNYNKYIKDKIGRLEPKNITGVMCQKIINEMLDNNKAPQTAKVIKEIITAIFKFFPNMGINNIENVGKLISIPKFDNTRHIELTEEQTKNLFSALFNYHDLKIRTIFIWLLHGRRKGEVLNIRWEDINFEQNLYTIESENSKINKTLKFSLTDTLIAALEEYGIKEKGLVFPSNMDINKIMSKTGMDYHWKNIRIATGLAGLNMHDLRHVVGGYGINHGFSLEVVGKTLGHTTANITQRYAKVQRESVKTVIDSLFEAYKPRSL